MTDVPVHRQSKLRQSINIFYQDFIRDEKSIVASKDMLRSFAKNNDFGLVSYKKQEGDLIYEAEFEENDPQTHDRMTTLRETKLSHWDLYIAHFRELFDEKEEGWFNNLLLIPIKVFLVLTVPYSQNPLMIGRLKYLPLAGWIVITGGAIFHFSHYWKYLFIAAGASLVFFLVVNRILKNTRVPKMLFDFVSFVTTLAWIKLVVSIMMDYLIFFSFYFSVSEIIVFSVIVSAGNSINEVLTTYALSKAGFGIMALISLFSGQFLNIVLSLGTNIYFSRNKTSGEFDIFGLYPEHPLHGEHLVAAQYMRVLTACVVIGLFTHFVANWVMKFELKKRFATFMLALYVTFVSLTINFHVSMNKKTPAGH